MDSPGPACFNALNRLVPLLRAETARRLVRAGLAQDRIAEHLGVSQAMVSKYVRRPAAPHDGVGARQVSNLADASVKAVLREEEKGTMPAWCPVCDVLSGRGLLCTVGGAGGATECERHEGGRAEPDRERILSGLRGAAERLARGPLRRLMPEVRSNLAVALPEAKTTRDVAAFPGRFTAIRGEVRAPAPPEFGASRHLAQILLKLRRRAPRLQAIMNVRYGEDVRAALRAANLKARILPRVHRELAPPRAPVADLDGVIDAGAFGIEPALYLLGESAPEVVRKAELLASQLKPLGET